MSSSSSFSSFSSLHRWGPTCILRSPPSLDDFEFLVALSSSSTSVSRWKDLCDNDVEDDEDEDDDDDDDEDDDDDDDDDEEEDEDIIIIISRELAALLLLLLEP